MQFGKVRVAQQLVIREGALAPRHSQHLCPVCRDNVIKDRAFHGARCFYARPAGEASSWTPSRSETSPVTSLLNDSDLSSPDPAARNGFELATCGAELLFRAVH